MIEAIRVECAVPAQISKIQAKKQNIFTTGNYSDISKKYSDAKSSQEIALLNLDKKISPSFKGNKFYEFPGAYSRVKQEEYMRNWTSHGPSFEEAQDYIKQNPGGYIEEKEATLQMHGMYSYPVGKNITSLGVYYIENNGTLTYFSNGDLQNYTEDKNVANYSPEDKVFVGLLSQYRRNEALAFAEKHNPSSEFAQKYLIEIYLKEGRYDEAIERFPKYWSAISERTHDIKYAYSTEAGLKRKETVTNLIAEKKIKEAIEQGVENLPYPLSRYTADELNFALYFLEGKESLEDWASKELSKAKCRATGFLSHEDTWDRLTKGIFTLGLSEVANVVSKELDKRSQISSATQKIERMRQCVSDILISIPKAKEELEKMDDEDNETAKVMELKKEPIRQELLSKFVNPFNNASENSKKLPSFVMLTGQNPYVMQELAQWSAKETNANYIKVNASYATKMRESIQRELEKAERHFRKTGEYSVIFVNGMEKLLNPNTNKTEDIYALKNAMNNAMQDYHSTIVFYAQNQDVISGINTQNGLAINVPIELDRNLYRFD